LSVLLVSGNETQANERGGGQTKLVGRKDRCSGAKPVGREA